MESGAHSEREREMLTQLIHQWNENRLDLFALSQPNEYLEFHGVMRFYFQETGQKVATKCLRVSSTATTSATIDALIEKFHPDLRMLTTPEYSLWEVHENGEERRLMPEERPLLVQLTWHKDDREGRFLLKRHGQQLPSMNQLASADNNQPSMKRKLSRREKKELRKQQKRAATAQPAAARSREAEDVGGKLYQEVPPTTFTRTISNPEIVMKKRRERKLQQKLVQMGEGGSLKVYGGSLNPEKPYVTLLVSNKDRADKLVRETLDKYGYDSRQYPDYCLVEVVIPASEKENAEFGQIPALSERIIGDNEFPLQLLEDIPTNTGSVVFHVRKRPSDAPRGRVSRHAPAVATPQSPVAPYNQLPFLVELHPDGSELMQGARTFAIKPNVTEVGSDRNLAHSPQALPLQGPYVHPRHCVLAYMDGVVTVTPCTPTAEIQVNGNTIHETTILKHAAVIRIARSHVFRYMDSNQQTGPFQSLQRSSSNQFEDRQVEQKEVTPTESMEELNMLLHSAAAQRSPTKEENVLEFETTFDVDGAVTTVVHAGEGMGLPLTPAPPRPGSRGPTASPGPLLSRDVIPAIIELIDSAEDAFLREVIREVGHATLQFKLAPVYVMYMVCRYRVSPHYRTSALPQERMSLLANFLTKAANLLHVTIQDYCHDSVALAFWMANSSEMLNLMKLDSTVNGATMPEPQESLADAVEKAFAHLCACLKQDLNQAMPAVLDPNLPDVSSVAPCMHMLNGAITLLRSCRVNAALTIQLFSHLFHYINMYLFNWLVSREGASYCCRSWGHQLSSRLRLMQEWALQHGLEMAAECHLDRCVQAAKLLQTPKNVDNLATLGATCYKLNSLQVRNLLERYRLEMGEQAMSAELIDNVSQLAENQADQMITSDGRSVQVEEEVDLQLPFLLPEDGYSPEIVRGIPPPLQQFVETLQHKGICRMILQPASSGQWTVHLGHSNEGENMAGMSGNDGMQPEIATITFQKDNGIGLHIVQVFDEDVAGIYVKKVVPGSAAGKDGRLEVGDQLLKVNGQSLVGITQEEAAAHMARCGPTVSFEVAKRAAIYKGLAAQLYAPPTEQPQHITAHNNGYNNGHHAVPAPAAQHYRMGSSSSVVPPARQQLPPQVQHGRSLSASHLHHDPGLQQQQQSQYQNLNSYQHHMQHQQPYQHNQNLSMSSMPATSMTRSAEYSRRAVSPSPLYANPPPPQQVRPPSVDTIGVYRASPPAMMNGRQRPSSQEAQPPAYQHQPTSPMLNDYHNLPLIPQEDQAGVNASPRAVSQPPYIKEEIPNAFAFERTAVSLPRVALGPAPYRQRSSPPQQHVQAPEDTVQHAYGYPEHPSVITQPSPPPIQQAPPESMPLSQSTSTTYSPPKQEPYHPEYMDKSPPTSSLSSHGDNQNADDQNMYMADPNDEHLDEKIDSEVIRLMREEVDRLESRPYLADEEQKRYRALKYELAYKTRLVEPDEDTNNDSQQTNSHTASNGLRRSDELEYLVELGEFGRGGPQYQPVTNGNSHKHESKLEHRMQMLEESIEHAAAPRPSELVEHVHVQQTNIETLQTHVQDITLHDRNYVAPVVKRAPPQVPPKRKVQFQPDNNPYASDHSSIHSEPSIVHAVQQPAPPSQPESRYVYSSGETEAPRVQVLGRQEVYRDPRQRRLEQQEMNREMNKPRGGDGAALPFKEKMRLFAAQIGENTPKEKMKVSSAQREIEVNNMMSTPQ